MKLYNEFRDIIKELGEIKLAWFTTFNLDLYFFEKYILSSLKGYDPTDLRTLKDYELLNEMFHARLDDDKPVNVRVFYDYRANHTSDSKKTSVSVQAINPAELKKTRNKFEEGVFHPKVVLLVNQENEAFILASSANLTLSAWARNTECACFKKINDKENAQRVTDFFKAFVDKNDTRQINQLNRYWQNNLRKNKDNWIFLNSFQNEDLLSHLIPGTKEMHVWSPYYSEDLLQLVEEMEERVEISIIPEIKENGTIRISEGLLQSIKSHPRIKLLKANLGIVAESPPFVHAKTWLTQDKLAIGSWNFTRAGLNLGGTNNNVEAGIINTIDPAKYKAMLSSCKLSVLDNIQGMKLEDLERERREVIHPYSFNCRVTADWENFKYSIDDLDLEEDTDHLVALPGLKEKVSVNRLCKQKISFLENYKILLKNRTFSVYHKSNRDNPVFIGIINEINTLNRPAFGFDNINELLNAWLTGNPSRATSKHCPQVKYDEETGEEVNQEMLHEMSADTSNGWFSMFLAMGEIRNKIEQKSRNEKELRFLGFHMPGSLIQLREHIYLLKDDSASGSKAVSKAFLWYLIHEGNQIFRHYNKLAKEYDIDRIDYITQINLSDALSGNKYTVDKINNWLEHISKDCYNTKKYG